MTVPVAGAVRGAGSCRRGAPRPSPRWQMTPLTAAARSSAASSTTTTLIVDGCHATGGVRPAAYRHEPDAGRDRPDSDAVGLLPHDARLGRSADRRAMSPTQRGRRWRLACRAGAKVARPDRESRSHGPCCDIQRRAPTSLARHGRGQDAQRRRAPHPHRVRATGGDLDALTRVRLWRLQRPAYASRGRFKVTGSIRWRGCRHHDVRPERREAGDLE